MNNIYDVLEICLQELENGVDLETVLARHSDLANELRPILQASILARTRSVAVPAPSPDVIRRGRTKLLQRALVMREQKATPGKRMIPIFQRLAISFTLTAIFLWSGTGLVGASSTALPGENLYPVKRTWEDLRLFFTFNPDHKEVLESEFESERLNEVGELLAEGRHETIQFVGVFSQVNGVNYVSGLTVLIPANLQVPANGAAVVVTGRTNAQGFVEIESIELLPGGTVVPVGKPVQVESESGSDSGSETGSENGSGSNSGSDSGEGTGSGSGNETQGNDSSQSSNELNSKSFEMKGTVESISDTMLTVNGEVVYLDNTKIEGTLKPGVNVEIKGYYAADGSFIVTELKVSDSESGGDSGNGDSSLDSGSGEDKNSDSNSDSNSDDSNDSDNGDDHSGSGGGGDD